MSLAARPIRIFWRTRFVPRLTFLSRGSVHAPTTTLRRAFVGSQSSVVLSSARNRDRAPDPSERPQSSRPKQAELLRRHGLKLDKRLGQHFLADPRITDRIADAVADLEPERVVELASGAGALSFALLDRGWPVTALELDPRMIDLLRAETQDREFEIVPTDLADTDYAALVDTRPMVFAGNLPYQVTSPILFGLLPALRAPSVRGAVVMVQAEVAARMSAAPGGRVYGILSVLLQAELQIQRLFTVKPGCFLPPPEVDSAVVRLVPRPDPCSLEADGTALVKSLFSQRRKQIGGILRKQLALDEPAVGRLLEGVALETKQRAETMSVEDFVRLRDAIRAEGWQ